MVVYSRGRQLREERRQDGWHPPRRDAFPGLPLVGGQAGGQAGLRERRGRIAAGLSTSRRTRGAAPPGGPGPPRAPSAELDFSPPRENKLARNTAVFAVFPTLLHFYDPNVRSVTNSLSAGTTDVFQGAEVCRRERSTAHVSPAPLSISYRCCRRASPPMAASTSLPPSLPISPRARFRNHGPGGTPGCRALTLSLTVASCSPRKTRRTDRPPAPPRHPSVPNTRAPRARHPAELGGLDAGFRRPRRRVGLFFSRPCAGFDEADSRLARPRRRERARRRPLRHGAMGAAGSAAVFSRRVRGRARKARAASTAGARRGRSRRSRPIPAPRGPAAGRSRRGQAGVPEAAAAGRAGVRCFAAVSANLGGEAPPPSAGRRLRDGVGHHTAGPSRADALPPISSLGGGAGAGGIVQACGRHFCRFSRGVAIWPLGRMALTVNTILSSTGLAQSRTAGPGAGFDIWP
jgi:hypothetical protein